MILMVKLTRVSELPCVSDARSRPGLENDSGCREFAQLLEAYLFGHGSMSNDNALSRLATQIVFQDREDIRGHMRAERRQRVADGGQKSHPWPPSRSVIDSVGMAGGEFAERRIFTSAQKRLI
jgi:hypothetical protein